MNSRRYQPKKHNTNQVIFVPKGSTEPLPPADTVPDRQERPERADKREEKKPRQERRDRQQNNNNYNNQGKYEQKYQPRDQNYQPKDQNKQNFQEERKERPQKQPRKKRQSSIQNPTNLCEELTKAFEEDSVDCLICITNIKVEQPIWSCGQCSAPFHLNCINKLIASNPANEPTNKTFAWACPKCCYLYNEPKPIYLCFCKRVQYPQVNYYGIPHSCNELCEKRRGPTCTHPCPLNCHPGPCPPCNSLAPATSCHCGKSEQQLKCSEMTSKDQSFSCGAVCKKKLSCGQHYCKDICHEGPCAPCMEKVTATCYCMSEVKDTVCSARNFSCGSVCGQVKDCGNHKCTKICHSGDCGECLLKPELVTSCPCGRMELQKPRKSCLDPIPTCDLPCRKPMPCRIHYCKRKCHEGDCGECLELVEQLCVCKAERRQLECFHIYKERETFQCERVCKKPKSCGVHKCTNSCCPGKEKHEPIHLCTKVCKKPLKCGKHTCDAFCHLGFCEPCRVYINVPLTCACGKSVKNPPLPCGTLPPSCSEPCSRPQPCEHPCPLKCHLDRCPPCIMEVDKSCMCGRNIIEKVACHKEALCTEPCRKKLNCGHLCDRVCHLGSCVPNPDAGCGQKCGKPRKICGHMCTLSCHYGAECPATPCTTSIKIKCDCGHREALVECGVVDHEIRHVLKCNNQCSNLKRFAALYTKVDERKPYYPLFLVRYAKMKPTFLKIEGRIENMVKEGEPNITIELQNDREKQQAIEMLVTHHYGLELDWYLKTAKPFVLIRNSEKIKFPNVKLSEYLRMIERNEVKLDVLPFEVSIRFPSLSRMDSADDLEELLREFKGKYYLEKNKEKATGLTVHFWERADAERAAAKLKKTVSYFSKFDYEENTKLASEEVKEKESTEVIQDLVIVSQKTTEGGQGPEEIVLDKLTDNVA